MAPFDVSGLISADLGQSGRFDPIEQRNMVSRPTRPADVDFDDWRILEVDVLVIGGGLAGERCAIEAATAGHEVLILSLVPPRRSHSCAAQGGMQASLGNCEAVC